MMVCCATRKRLVIKNITAVTNTKNRSAENEEFRDKTNDSEVVCATQQCNVGVGVSSSDSCTTPIAKYG